MSSDIKKIGIIGAGQMGGGIAHVCALAGHDVYLMDINEDSLTGALAVINKNMTRAVSKDKLAQVDMEAGLALISTGSSYDDFKDCDLVIEAATENEELKKEIIREICKVVPEHTIIASKPRLFPSPGWARRPTGLASSSACTS